MTRVPIFCAFESYYAKPFGFALTALGSARSNGANLYAYDLAVCPKELQGLSDSALSQRLSETPRPLRIIRANADPILMAFKNAHGLTSAAEIPAQELEGRAASISADASFRRRLISLYEALLPARQPSAFVEEQIYDGFISNPDQKILDAFHESPWERRAELLEQLSDPRLRQLGKRLLFFERPDLLEGSGRAAQARKMAERLLDPAEDVPWLTLPRAIEELNGLLATANDEDASHLIEHRRWIERRLAEAKKMAKPSP
jgi:exodeoxyribonuclease-1